MLWTVFSYVSFNRLSWDLCRCPHCLVSVTFFLMLISIQLYIGSFVDCVAFEGSDALIKTCAHAEVMSEDKCHISRELKGSSLTLFVINPLRNTLKQSFHLSS